MQPGIQRGHLTLAVSVAVLAAVVGGCRGPATVVRPDMTGRPVSAAPPVAEGSDEELPELDFHEQIRALLAGTREPVRLRVLAHPLEGDPVTDELIAVCRSVLELARSRTRFDAHDPVASPEAAEEARILGVVPLGSPPSRRRREPLPLDAEYRALVVAVGREHLVVPQITADRGDMEFQVAEAISRLLHGPRLVGLVADAEREGRLNKLRRVLDRLDVLPVSLEEPLSPELSALIVVGPGKRLKRGAVETIERFLDQGRSVAFLLDGMEVEPAQKRYTVRRARSGLEDLLDERGITLENGLVFDNRCGRVSVPARVGRMLLPYPPIPTVIVEEQDMTPDAREVRLPFPSSLRIDPPEGVRVTPLLKSSDDSWRVDRGYDLSPYQQWSPTSRTGPFLFGAVLEREKRPRRRIAVVANARFIEDQYLEKADNALFVRQLVEWLGGHRALSQIIQRDFDGTGVHPRPPAKTEGPVASEAPPGGEEPEAPPVPEKTGGLEEIQEAGRNFRKAVERLGDAVDRP